MRVNNIKKKWNSIRTQVIVVLVFTNGVIILLLSIGGFLFYRSSFIHEIADTRADVLRQISERARQFKDNVYTVSNLYWNDKQFQKMVSELTCENSEDFDAYMDELSRHMEVSFNQVNLEFYVCFLSTDGIGYSSVPVKEDYDYMNPEIKIWYRDIYDARGEIVSVANYKDHSLGIDSYSAARTVLNEEGEIKGYLMINANERQLYKMYSEVRNDKSNIYITNDEGRIISSNEESMIGLAYFNMKNLEKIFDGRDYVITNISNHKALFSRYYDPVSGFTVFEDIPLDDVLYPIKHVRNIVLVLSMLSVAGGGIMAWHFSGRIAAPIRKLCGNVQEVENGSLEQDFTVDSFTELNELSNGMNRMLRRICALIDSVEIKEAQKRKMEMKWLQAQINPHFMYNTLFSIKCMVDMQRNEEAGNMLLIFIQILRGILQKPEEMEKISSQMETLRRYIELQRFRYGNSFDLLIEYDEDIAECYIPKLLVQPIVENAIVHGFSENQTNRVLSVFVGSEKNSVLICIEDNGSGMTAEQISQIMQAKPDKESTHLGIKNVQERIQLLYGEEWGLEIDSTPGQGTKVTICIPLKK